MGKQIGFCQLESDIQNLLDFLKQHDLNIYDSKGNILISNEDVCKHRMVAINKKYIPKTTVMANSPIEYIVPLPLDTAEITETRFYMPDPEPGYVMKGTQGKKIVMDGRFYLSNEYYQDDDIVAVYNLLKKYIRKNYIYSKAMGGTYFSPAFIEEYKNGEVYAANGTNVFPITDV